MGCSTLSTQQTCLLSQSVGPINSHRDVDEAAEQAHVPAHSGALQAQLLEADQAREGRHVASHGRVLEVERGEVHKGRACAHVARRRYHPRDTRPRAPRQGGRAQSAPPAAGAPVRVVSVGAGVCGPAGARGPTSSETTSCLQKRRGLDARSGPGTWPGARAAGPWPRPWAHGLPTNMKS
mgnify:CR=1 FL=1